MSYQAVEAPRDPKHLPEFISRQLHRLENELRDGASIRPTLAGTWANTGGEYAVVSYHRDHHQHVHLHGMAQSGVRITDSYTVVLTLPEKYRPLATEVFACSQGSEGAYVRVDVTSAGVVKAWKWNGTWLNLAGIDYLAER